MLIILPLLCMVIQITFINALGRLTNSIWSDSVCFLGNSYPIFENPYPLTIHESPVTCCEYFADCPVDLIPALYSVGSRQKRQGYSKKVTVANLYSLFSYFYLLLNKF